MFPISPSLIRYAPIFHIHWIILNKLQTFTWTKWSPQLMSNFSVESVCFAHLSTHSSLRNPWSFKIAAALSIFCIRNPLRSLHRCFFALFRFATISVWTMAYSSLWIVPWRTDPVHAYGILFHLALGNMNSDNWILPIIFKWFPINIEFLGSNHDQSPFPLSFPTL